MRPKKLLSFKYAPVGSATVAKTLYVHFSAVLRLHFQQGQSNAVAAPDEHCPVALNNRACLAFNIYIRAHLRGNDFQTLSVKLAVCAGRGT